MSGLTFGFYNSFNKDRVYNARTFSQIFDGIINDGIFMSIGSKLMVTPSSTGLAVVVGTGRAWFNSTWSLNSTPSTITLDTSDLIHGRIDAIVLEVNNSDSVRANALKTITGAPSANPVKPTLLRSEFINQYALAYVTVDANATTIVTADIENAVGIGDTPFVTGILETMDVGPMITEWKAEWSDWNDDVTEEWSTLTTRVADEWLAQKNKNQSDFDYWFNNVKDSLTDDAAGNLYTLVNARVKIADKASNEDAMAGTSDTKWMTPATTKRAIQQDSMQVGDFKISALPLDERYPDQYILPNKQSLPVDEYPEYLENVGYTYGGGAKLGRKLSTSITAIPLSDQYSISSKFYAILDYDYDLDKVQLHVTNFDTGERRTVDVRSTSSSPYDMSVEIVNDRIYYWIYGENAVQEYRWDTDDLVRRLSGLSTVHMMVAHANDLYVFTTTSSTTTTYTVYQVASNGSLSQTFTLYMPSQIGNTSKMWGCDGFVLIKRSNGAGIWLISIPHKKYVYDLGDTSLMARIPIYDGDNIEFIVRRDSNYYIYGYGFNKNTHTYAQTRNYGVSPSSVSSWGYVNGYDSVNKLLLFTKNLTYYASSMYNPNKLTNSPINDAPQLYYSEGVYFATRSASDFPEGNTGLFIGTPINTLDDLIPLAPQPMQIAGRSGNTQSQYVYADNSMDVTGNTKIFMKVKNS